MPSRDYDFCPMCNGLIEANGDNWCVCDDVDDYGDYLYHQRKDETEANDENI